MSDTPRSTPPDQISSRLAIRWVLGPFKKRVLVFCISTFMVGLLEAVFLVAVTRTGLAIASGQSAVGLTTNVEVTISESLLISAALLVARFALYYVTTRLQVGLQYRITTTFRKQLGTGFLRASWETQQREPSGTLQQIVVQFPSQISYFVGQVGISLAGILGLAALLSTAIVIDVASTLILVTALLTLTLVLEPFRRMMRIRSSKAIAAQVAFANNVTEVAEMSLEINALGISDEASTRLAQIIERDADAQFRVSLTSGLVSPVYMSLAYGAVLVGLYALNSIGSDDINQVGAVMLIMLRSLSYGQQIQGGLTAIGQYGPYAQKLIQKREEFFAARRPSGDTEVTTAERLTASEVSFAYPDQPLLLDRIEFSLRRGETVALIGPSGAGKTTLVQLLLGLRLPDRGSIAIDGTDTAHVDRESWHRLVTYVPQETRLLSATIEDNIGFLRSHVTEQDVWRAIDQSNLRTFVDSLPDGIDTLLGPAGQSLSGGQKQRVSIARALVTRPSLLILDEPTASLDQESETVLNETIAALKNDVAVLVVTHKASTLAACDRALVLENGRLTEVSVAAARDRLDSAPR
jgi:ABC-type multidrug transport system fused ATPase/permease subunit